MGNNVRLQDAPKQSEIITAKVKLKKDLRSCMKCKFFYGNNRQCPASRCIKEESKPETVEAVKESQCYCPMTSLTRTPRGFATLVLRFKML